MSVCACPQGIIRRDCDYHREVARRFLELVNTRRLITPSAPVAGTFARGGYTPKEDA